MGKKNNTALLIIGGLGIGYLLAPKALKDQLGLPGIGISLGDIGGGLMPSPGIDLPGLDLPGLDFPTFPEGWADKLLPEINIPELPEPLTPPDIPGIVEGLLKDLIPAIPPAPVVDTTLPAAPPGPWEWFTNLNPVVQNIAATVGVVGAGYGTYKGLQIVAPASKTVFSGLADTFARFLKGKPPTPKPPVVGKPPIPPGVNPKLWLQWLKHTPLGSTAVRRLAGGFWGFAAIPVEWTMPPEELAEIRELSAYGPIWDNLVALVTGKPQPQYPGIEKGLIGPIPAERDFTPRETRAYPELSYERDRAPRPKAYGGIEKGYEPPDITQRPKVRERPEIPAQKKPYVYTRPEIA